VALGEAQLHVMASMAQGAQLAVEATIDRGIEQLGPIGQGVTMKIISGLLLGLACLPAWAASSVACFQDCSRQGYDRSQCVTLCERNQGGVGLLDQPGVPRNPYLDALPDPVPKGRQTELPVNIDQRCMDDCRAQRHQYGYCRKQCAY
jgi:hypothetical protein